MKKIISVGSVCLLLIACAFGPRPKLAIFKNVTQGEPEKYKILGVTWYLDKEMSNKKYAFYISDPAGVKMFEDSISGSEIGGVYLDSNSFDLYIIKGKVGKPLASVNPLNKNIIYQRRYYRFDPVQFENLRKKYPIDYKGEYLEFETNDQIQDFIYNHQADDALLFYENTTSPFEGDATIYIKRTGEINAGEKAMDLLTSEVSKMTSNPHEYQISYTPRDNETEAFECGLSTSKSIYDRLSSSLIVQKKWQANHKELLVYWRK